MATKTELNMAHHCNGAEARSVGAGELAISFVLHYTACVTRPRERSKPARLTVKLDRAAHASLVEFSKREETSVSWVVGRVIEALAACDPESPV